MLSPSSTYTHSLLLCLLCGRRSCKQAFSEWIFVASRAAAALGRKLLFVVDGLQRTRAHELTDWLPPTLPSNFYLIATVDQHPGATAVPLAGEGVLGGGAGGAGGPDAAAAAAAAAAAVVAANGEGDGGGEGDGSASAPAKPAGGGTPTAAVAAETAGAAAEEQASSDSSRHRSRSSSSSRHARPHSKDWAWQFTGLHVLPTLAEEDREEFLTRMLLHDYGKKLTEEQMARISRSSPLMGNPLALKLLCGELLHFGIFEELDEKIGGLLEHESIAALYGVVVRRLWAGTDGGSFIQPLLAFAAAAAAAAAVGRPRAAPCLPLTHHSLTRPS